MIHETWSGKMTDFDLAEYGDQRVVAVALAKNEEKTIVDLVERARHYVHEVIVMDGHSIDNTVIAAKRAGATVYTDSGLGKGAAIRQSLETTRADVVIFIDSDGSHAPTDIPRLALPVVRKESDLCVGSRFTGGSDELSVNVGQLIRTLGNISMNIAINTRWNTQLTDTLNGFRAARREALLSIGLHENTHTIEQEMVMKMLRKGYRVTNVPAHEYQRQYGRSHINIWLEWPRFVWCMIVNLL